MIPGHDHDALPEEAPKTGMPTGHDDLNLRSAYLHVIADAFTSVLAIVALSCGAIFGWSRLDPLCGIVGSLVIAQWAWSLIMRTRMILLDYEPETCDLRFEIQKAMESCPDTRICDLHIWQVGVNRYSAIISIVTGHPETPQYYKQLLSEHSELQHVTVEINAVSTGE